MKVATKPNRAGILLLAKDLFSHKKLYDQNTEGMLETCGTVGCMAGFCHARKIGRRAYNLKVRRGGVVVYQAHMDGHRQLGLTVVGIEMAQIFNVVSYWPSDLRMMYESNGPASRVMAALMALQRLHVDGTIDPDPKKIITRIPQLKVLRDAVKKSKRK